MPSPVALARTGGIERERIIVVADFHGGRSEGGLVSEDVGKKQVFSFILTESDVTQLILMNFNRSRRKNLESIHDLLSRLKFSSGGMT